VFFFLLENMKYLLQTFKRMIIQITFKYNTCFT